MAGFEPVSSVSEADVMSIQKFNEIFEAPRKPEPKPSQKKSDPTKSNFFSYDCPINRDLSESWFSSKAFLTSQESRFLTFETKFFFTWLQPFRWKTSFSFNDLHVGRPKRNPTENCREAFIQCRSYSANV
jgi:hypothetical protein